MIAAVLHGEKAARALGRGIARGSAGCSAMHARHAVHGGETLRIDARRAARDDDLRLGPFAMQAADRLARLPRRLAGDGAGVDDDVSSAAPPCLARQLLRIRPCSAGSRR